MKKMTILFPGSYMNYRDIDEDMKGEYCSVLNTGLFDIILFNYDEWLAGGKLRLKRSGDSSKKTIYRGWMLKPDDYGKLYQVLQDYDIELITSPREYENLHLFPNVYPHIKNDTAGLIEFKDREVDINAVKKQFAKFMVKDSVKSVKGTEFPAFFDQSISQEEFDQWMEVFYKYRGDLLTGGICIKEYLELKRYGDKTNEVRVFYANHQILSVSRNSLQSDYTEMPPEGLIGKYAELDSPYYTIDYAELSDGSWKIIEAGYGEVSGLSPGQDMEAYFRALYHSFMDTIK